MIGIDPAVTVNRQQARILAAHYEEKVVQGAESESYYYMPRVRYAFAAAGGEHEGARPFLIRKHWSSEGPAKAWAAAHGQGATVPVWFDPADPSQSALVLDKPRSFMPAFVMAIGVCVAVFGAYMAVAVV